MKHEIAENKNTIPEFCPDEIMKIRGELHIFRWKEIGKVIPVNEQWQIIITKSEGNALNVGKTDISDIVTCFTQTGSIYVYWGYDDEHEGTGYRLIPTDPNQENPYEVLLSPLEKEIETLRTNISRQIQCIQESITDLQREVKNLESEKEKLERKKKQLQQDIWGIPHRIIAGDTLDQILTDLSDTKN